jgi:hypothetical protein
LIASLLNNLIVSILEIYIKLVIQVYQYKIIQIFMILFYYLFHNTFCIFIIFSLKYLTKMRLLIAPKTDHDFSALYFLCFLSLIFALLSLVSVLHSSV